MWRVDRLATVIVPGTRDVQPSFAPVAKHYGAIVEPCPPRRGNRKGSVESAVRYTCGRWWRTMTATTPEEAQLSLDQIFDNPTVAAAMLDRLLHRSVVFNIDGESYRMRAHRAHADKLRKGVNQQPST